MLTHGGLAGMAWGGARVWTLMRAGGWRRVGGLVGPNQACFLGGRGGGVGDLQARQRMGLGWGRMASEDRAKTSKPG